MRVMLSAGHKSGPPSEIWPALVMPAGQQIAVHDLGEAVSLDSQVEMLLSSLRSPVSDPTKSANARYDQVLKPLLPPTARHLYLSLDGSLSLVPFDALHDGTDYLLLVDPDFGRALAVQGTEKSETFYRRLAGLTRLPGAQEEAKQIGPLLHVAPVVARAAKESVVRVARAPWASGPRTADRWWGHRPWLACV